MSETHPHLFSLLRDMSKNEGILSLYKGMESPLITIPLVNSIVFGAYEFIKKILKLED
jgi:hypothetical protein